MKVNFTERAAYQGFQPSEVVLISDPGLTHLRIGQAISKKLYEEIAYLNEIEVEPFSEARAQELGKELKERYKGLVDLSKNASVIVTRKAIQL